MLLIVAAALGLSAVSLVRILPLFDAEHAVDAADETADDTAHGRTDDRAKRTGDAVAVS